MEKKRATGERASPGNLPLRLGGRGNVCFAVVKAEDSNTRVFAKARIEPRSY